MIRNSLFLPLMAAAIGGPILLMSGSKDGNDAEDETIESVSRDVELANYGSEGQKNKFYEPIESLSDVFSFGQSSASVEQRFPGATRSELNGFQVYRSSVVSGHGDQDIAGAITYEFTFRGKLKRIRFHGFVIDPAKLLRTLNSDFGFRKSDELGIEYKPTAFSGYSGILKLTKSTEYKGQLNIELDIVR